MTKCLFVVSLFALCCCTLALDQCTDETDSYCFHETCALPLYDPHVGVPCACTGENVGHKFGDCINGSRDIIYFWRPPATCINGTLPPPVSGFPCDQRCQDGQYIDLTSKLCTPCDSGSISFGTGHTYDDWSDWPGQIATYCAIGDQTKTCSSWALAGETINSGDNHLVNYLESILEYRVQILFPGWVAFRFRVEAEQYYDGLYFVIDDLSYFFISNTDWTVYNRSLSVGYHTIAWQYYKDRLLTVGRDRADIDWIEVRGSTYGPVSCENCPAGHHQPDAGQSGCVPCVPGTYMPTTGATQCLPCGIGKSSFAGASSCFNQEMCSELYPYFYTAYYTPCLNGQRTLMYDWIYPLACANPENVTLPQSSIESCVPDPCNAGQFRLSPNDPCQYCPSGYASAANSQCTPCNSGYAAQNKIAYFNSWASWPQGTGYSFTTNCSGDDCITNGWRLAQTYIDSGVGQGADTFSYVDMTIDIFPGASVTFNYSLQCAIGNELIFSFNGFVLNSFQCSGSCSAGFQTFNFTFRNFFFTDNTKNESFTLRWGYAKHNADPSPCDRAVVSNIRVTGVALTPGGSGGCVQCPPGSFAENGAAVDSCTPCGTGYGSVGGLFCQACPDLTFSDAPGAPCLACGAMTDSNITRSQCTFNCSAITFTSLANISTVYNVSSIGNWNATLQIFATNSTIQYNFNGGVCDWNPACLDRNGNPMHSHFCYQNSTFTVNMGKAPSITEISPRGGVRFDYAYGSQFPWSRSVQCTSSLILMCEKDQTFSGPTLTPQTSVNDLNTNCHTELVFRTKYACPMCKTTDFASFDTACDNGVKQRAWYVKSSDCYGGEPLPPSEEIDCGPEVTLQKNTVIVVVVLSFAILAGAAAGLIVLYLRNKRLHNDYNMLVNQTVPMMDTKESASE